MTSLPQQCDLAWNYQSHEKSKPARSDVRRYKEQHIRLLGNHASEITRLIQPRQRPAIRYFAHPFIVIQRRRPGYQCFLKSQKSMTAALLS